MAQQTVTYLRLRVVAGFCTGHLRGTRVVSNAKEGKAEPLLIARVLRSSPLPGKELVYLFL